MFGGRGAAGKGKGGLGDAVGGKGDGKRPGAPDAGGGAGRSKSETSGGPTRSWAGDEDSWQHDHPLPSRFGELRALTAGAVDEIRKAQKKLFEDHELLETVPGQDFDFLGAFEDTFVGEDSSEARFKPLGKWFENKERVVERLTMHLEKACEEMVNANMDASNRIEGQDK